MISKVDQFVVSFPALTISSVALTSSVGKVKVVRIVS